MVHDASYPTGMVLIRKSVLKNIYTVKLTNFI